MPRDLLKDSRRIFADRAARFGPREGDEGWEISPEDERILDPCWSEVAAENAATRAANPPEPKLIEEESRKFWSENGLDLPE